jgi:magnesium chelatase family protein
MLAKWIPTVLPDLSFEEAVEVPQIYSALIATRPFRSPHHTISDAGLIGGGQIPKPFPIPAQFSGVPRDACEGDY